MLRPATLSRAFAAAPRLLLPQSTPTTLFLARRSLTTTTSTPAPEPTPTPTQPPSTSSQQPTEQIQTQSQKPKTGLKPQSKALPYHVGRTPSNQLAVYQLAKRGGNKLLTVIKKVEGDSTVLREDMAAGLGLMMSEVTPNKFTGHVVVAGHRRSEIVDWLQKQGF